MLGSFESEIFINIHLLVCYVPMIVVQYALKLLQSVTWDLFVIERLNEGYGSRERDKVCFTVKMRAFLA